MVPALTHDRLPQSSDRPAAQSIQPAQTHHRAVHPVHQLQQTAGNQFVQRQIMRTTAGGDPPQPGAATQTALKNPGGGRPLPPALRSRMERSLGTELSQVRTHTDSSAARATQELNAKAFTHGQNIYFGSGQYQPEQAEGQHLLAHELVHTVQQRGTSQTPQSTPLSPVVSRSQDALEQEAEFAADRIQAGQRVAIAYSPAPAALLRQEAAAPAGGPSPAAPSGGTADLPAGVPVDEISLAASTFAPTPAVAAYLEAQGRSGGNIRVRFGTLAQGTIPVQQSQQSYETPGSGRAAYKPIPLTHPALQPLQAAGINPVLAVRIEAGAIDGYLTVATGREAAGNPAALATALKDHSREMGWLGINIGRMPAPTNTLTEGSLRFQLLNFPVVVGGYVNGTGSFGLEDERLTFQVSAMLRVPRLTEAQLEISRDPQGNLTGQAEVPVSLANFSGNLLARYRNGVVDVRGTVGYQAEKFSGEVTLLVTDQATARNVARQQLGPEAIAQSAQQSAGGGEAGEPRPGPRAVAGFGTLNFAFTEWLTGRATVIIDNEGHITVIGEIAPPAEVELFPQRDYIYDLFTVEIRTLYGVPLVGNVFLFANIGMQALAKLGPGKLYNIVVQGVYSTDPEVLQHYSLQASLNISAFAGLRLRAEGGVGVELLGHDIKAGVGLNALAGVRGYVEATPTIGYRETADPQAGRKGEYFIKGHMELAAQPFLGLSGDLFVQLDSPWWSPAPDKTWTWPLGQLEYPLPGEFGLGADVDYVIGSGELPRVQMGAVNFDSGKFMTDLMNDHVPPRQSSDQERQGTWQQDETTGTAADPTVANQTTSPTGAPAQGQQPPGQQRAVPAPGVQQRWLQGMQALGNLAQQSRSNPLSQTELTAALAPIRTTYGFRELRATHVGEDWRVHASMNPEGDITIEGETEPAEGSGAAATPASPPPTPASIPLPSPGTLVRIYDNSKRKWVVGDFKQVRRLGSTDVIEVTVGRVVLGKPVTAYNQDQGWKNYSSGATSINYGSLDSMRRPTGIQATLGLPLTPGTKASFTPPGFGGAAAGHARGHLLGKQLGGSGSEARNIVALFQNPVNTPLMSGYEGQVRQAVENGEIVTYKVTPTYSGSNPMPAEIVIEATGDGGFSLSVRIPNHP